MEKGMFEKEIQSEEIKNIVNHIMDGALIEGIFRVCEQYDENAEDYREYDVYKIITDSKNMILKKLSNVKFRIMKNILIRKIFEYLSFGENGNAAKTFGS